MDGGGVIDVTAMGLRDNLPVPANIDALLAVSGGPETVREVLKAPPVYANTETIKYAPVVLEPRKILCAGLNYADHAGETGMRTPRVPMIFAKLNNALNGHDCGVELIDTAVQYDYEAELVAVIGKRCKFVSEEKAPEYVFGYTCGNDLSAREVQAATSQYLMGKSFDGMCPVGPCIVTSGSIDVSNLPISCKVNGELRQSSYTRHLIFSCAKLISYASQYMTLEPGDLFFTGTPGGVILGYPPDKRVWLKKGDVVEVEIGGIGTLRNTMV